LIEHDRGSADIEAAKQWMADNESDELGISRGGFNGISTNGVVIMEPESGSIHVCHGPSRAAGWVALRGA
jgi:isopenicillin-N N-acyltransferase-like protein